MFVNYPLLFNSILTNVFFHRPAILPDDVGILVLFGPVCVLISLLLETHVMDVVFMGVCLFLCSRAKELKRAREHETPQKSPLAM